jgi:hypothetical protein
MAAENVQTSPQRQDLYQNRETGSTPQTLTFQTQTGLTPQILAALDHQRIETICPVSSWKMTIVHLWQRWGVWTSVDKPTISFPFTIDRKLSKYHLPCPVCICCHQLAHAEYPSSQCRLQLFPGHSEREATTGVTPHSISRLNSQPKLKINIQSNTRTHEIEISIKVHRCGRVLKQSFGPTMTQLKLCRKFSIKILANNYAFQSVSNSYGFLKNRYAFP